MKYLILTTLGTLVLAVIGLAFRSSAMERRTGPVPYLTNLGEHAADAIAVTAPCALCDLGLGHCVCTVRCVADACEGRSTLATWTDRDFEWAAAQGFSLGERSELQ